MGNLFGKKTRGPSKVTEQDRAVLQLKQQRDKLRLYQKRIETLLEKDRNLARELVSEGKKERALLLLRKKRYQESLLTNTDKQLNNLEQLTSDIEFAQVEVQVVQGLQVGNKALKEINEMLNIDDIERILDETKEAYDKQEEISAMISGSLSQEDEDSVLEELDQLVSQSQEVTTELPVVGMETYDNEGEDIEDEEVFQDMRLPDVPNTAIKGKESREKRLMEAPLES